LEHPEPDDRAFSVKVPVRDGADVEHIWLENVRQENGVFHGTLGNVPELVRGRRQGEWVSEAAATISDWMYVHDDHLVGGYTLRLMFARMSPAERADATRGLDFTIESP
jgi:uncharacterized protein YegJ (DUF2314 family)